MKKNFWTAFCFYSMFGCRCFTCNNLHMETHCGLYDKSSNLGY